MLQKLFNQGGIKLGLSRAQQQGEADGLAANDREINRVNVFIVHENMIHRWWKVGGDGIHKYEEGDDIVELCALS